MKKKGATIAVIAGVIAIACAAAYRARTPKYLAEAALGDGRILRIEQVDFGTESVAGSDPVLFRAFRQWLPAKIRAALQPDVPRNDVKRDNPALIIWVNAISDTTRTNVDCQGLRIELSGPSGARYSEDHISWFGGQRFWRVAHVFDAFPRDSETIKMRVAVWNRTNLVEVTIPNPGKAEPANWTGEPLPIRRELGEYEVVLKELKNVTNKEVYWRFNSEHLDPVFEIWKHGVKQERGWNIEWTAEDRYGNRGQEFGRTEPVLKFKASFIPAATNFTAALRLVSIPEAPLDSTTNLLWELRGESTNAFRVLGLFPPGVHVFSNGEYLSNPPVHLAAVHGGAKSGWVSQTSNDNPLRVTRHYGHYTDAPVIYVRYEGGGEAPPVGLRYSTGKEWFAAEPEAQGHPDGVYPFIVRTASGAKRIRSELVLLPPLKTEFLVQVQR